MNNCATVQRVVFMMALPALIVNCSLLKFAFCISDRLLQRTKVFALLSNRNVSSIVAQIYGFTADLHHQLLFMLSTSNAIACHPISFILNHNWSVSKGDATLSVAETRIFKPHLRKSRTKRKRFNEKFHHQRCLLSPSFCDFLAWKIFNKNVRQN